MSSRVSAVPPATLASQSSDAQRTGWGTNKATAEQGAACAGSRRPCRSSSCLAYSRPLTAGAARAAPRAPGLSRCLPSSPLGERAQVREPSSSARRCASPPQARARPRPALLRAGRGGGAVPRRPSSGPPAPLMNIDVSPPRDVAAVPGREPEPPRCWPRGRMRERRQAPSRLPARRLAPQPAGAAQGAASRVEGRRRGGDAAALRGAGGAAAAAAVAAGAAARAAGLSARRQRQVPGRAGRVSLGTRRGRPGSGSLPATFPTGGVGRCGERGGARRLAPGLCSRVRCRPALLRGGTWSLRPARCTPLRTPPLCFCCTWAFTFFLFACEGKTSVSAVFCWVGLFTANDRALTNFGRTVILCCLNFLQVRNSRE